jgi:5'-nucleotidase (lipoprotein e(P4) family)
MRRFALLALVLVSAACRVATAPVAAPLPTPALAERSNEALLLATLWVQTAGEYRAAALQAFGGATRALDANLAAPEVTAAVEQTGSFETLPPAVIVDIDETMLDNSPFEARLILEGGSFSEELWAGWVEERSARAIPGAVEFARHAASRGVVVFYVSNRVGEAEEATRENLRAAGFPVDERYDTVMLRGERDEWKASDKASRRAAVAERHRILLMIGDDLGDFLPDIRTAPAAREAMVDRYASWWGTRWFVVPNPMYGSWEGALTSGVPPQERKRRLLESLRAQR